jgi:hypothetical protein
VARAKIPRLTEIKNKADLKLRFAGITAPCLREHDRRQREMQTHWLGRRRLQRMSCAAAFAGTVRPSGRIKAGNDHIVARLGKGLYRQGKRIHLALPVADETIGLNDQIILPDW